MLSQVIDVVETRHLKTENYNQKTIDGQKKESLLCIK